MSFIFSTITPVLLIVVGACLIVAGIRDIIYAIHLSEHPMKQLLKESPGLRLASGGLLIFSGAVTAFGAGLLL